MFYKANDLISSNLLNHLLSELGLTLYNCCVSSLLDFLMTERVFKIRLSYPEISGSHYREIVKNGLDPA